MIMRERLYKDAHPLHKVSKKNFYFIFLKENPLAKNGKKNKEKKKVPRKKKRGGESPLTIYFLVQEKNCPYGGWVTPDNFFNLKKKKIARTASYPCWRKLVACA